MQTVKTIGLDIAKSMFQVHGVDAAGHSLKLLRSPDFQGNQGHASRFGAKRRETAARLGRMGRREGGPARRGCWSCAEAQGVAARILPPWPGQKVTCNAPPDPPHQDRPL
jgi:hypothetical protein